MTITRTFDVTITRRVRINLPDAFDTPEMLAEWCSGLWHIEGVEDIAEYAARLAADGSAEYDNDGVGRMVSEIIANHRKELDPLTVTYSVLSDDVETEQVDQ